MEIKHGKGTTEYGPGIDINLDGEEIVTAISAYLVSQGVHVRGPRTISVNGELIEDGNVYVDPSGFVAVGGKRIDGSKRANSLHEVSTAINKIHFTPTFVQIKNVRSFDVLMQGLTLGREEAGMGDTIERMMARDIIGDHLNSILLRPEPWIWEIVAEYFTV